MKPSQRQHPAQGGMDLVEEATQLLRTAPVTVLATYYLGSLPFVLGLLYFWADMSGNPFARQHAAEESLTLALLYLWMKFWQVIFARQIRALVALEPAPAASLSRFGKIFLTQTMLQPWSFFILPLALITVLPFAAVYAFFQNLTVLDGGEALPTRVLLQRAGRLARLWPRQNLGALLILAAFALIVFLNWLTVGFSLPRLVQTLLGIESVFSRSGIRLLNTTFLATMLGLTYLCIDPMIKTLYVLRCFYGEAVHSGEDLRARLKQLALQARAVAVGLVVIISVVGTHSLFAAEAPPPAVAPASAPASPPAVSPAELNQSIDKVIHQNKYVWRQARRPADEDADADEGIIAGFLRQVRTTLGKMVDAFWDWVRRLLEGLMPEGGGSRPSLFATMTLSQVLILVLIAVVVCVLAVLLLRFWRRRQARPAAQASTAFQAAPDLLDENVGAEQLPEDGWTKLGRELLERGEYRLALRAFYLSGLAHLAGRNLLSLAKFKSNRDYERELRRRGHAFPELPPAFGETVAMFERVWYGLHEANRELVSRFTVQVDKLKAVQ